MTEEKHFANEGGGGLLPPKDGNNPPKKKRKTTRKRRKPIIRRRSAISSSRIRVWKRKKWNFYWVKATLSFTMMKKVRSRSFLIFHNY